MDSHTHSHPATSLKREHFDLDSAFLQEQHDSYDYGYPLSKRPFASSRGGIRLPALFSSRQQTPPPNKRARKEQQQQLQQRYLQRSSGKSDQHLTKSPLASPPSPLDAQSPKSTLDDLLTAIALDNKLIQELEGVATKFKGVAHPDEEIRSARRAQTPATVSSQDSSEDEAESEPRQPHDPHALRVLFLAPNWLENHMAKAKRLAAMQEQQQ
ncbi:hypothetical protein BGW38_006127 [Lunasporangiospora selenospora]|uniref:Uncharacterized protein n=1 Tax=Lunasporangiospora selenospora TaxID=979761 RepID=A0A9P6FM75_9FUNG|nr:hypothetical protein BGW38_006127 [Lunasporangiospora selenospora]